MKAKGSKARRVRILLMLLIAVSSAVITTKLKQQYPKITLSNPGYNQTNVSSPIKTANRICAPILRTVFYLDETRANEGDLLMLRVDYPHDSRVTVKGGLRQDEMVPLKKGENTFGPVYYKVGSNTLFIQVCGTVSQGYDEPGDIVEVVSFQFVRPSFVDSWIGSILVFITSFVLLGEFFKLISYYFSWRNK